MGSLKLPIPLPASVKARRGSVYRKGGLFHSSKQMIYRLKKGHWPWQRQRGMRRGVQLVLLGIHGQTVE
jgi:hypothetical protein